MSEQRYEDPAEYEMLRDAVIEHLDPCDDDVAEVALMIDAVAGAGANHRGVMAICDQNDVSVCDEDGVPHTLVARVNTLVATLRAQLASATATIAEQTQRAEVGRLLDDPALLETLAAIEHERWAGWEEYRAEKSDRIHISGESYQGRWLRQRNTPYDKLSEDEKESDRVEVRRSLAAIRAALATPANGAATNTKTDRGLLTDDDDDDGDRRYRDMKPEDDV